ncbi:MAG: maleylpyruvate isomerase family mycothiol-dependent enzyme [Candidatus Dormibacterales bacterium]
MPDFAGAYRETYEGMRQTLSGMDADLLGRKVPFSPLWNVRDVVAHVTAEAAMAAGGDPELAGLDVAGAWMDPAVARRRDELNARQIEQRAGRSLGEVLDEWSAHVPLVERMLRGEISFPISLPFIESILVTDLAMHGQDIRSVAGAPGARDSAAVGIALGSFAGALGLKLQALSVPALRLRYGGKERVLGDSPIGATVTADRFEVIRALAGRRSTSQIRALEWEGDPEPYLPLIPAYGPREDSIED